MNRSRSNFGRKAAAVGAVALVGGIGALSSNRAGAATTLSGVDDFQETTATSAGNVSTTNTTPGTQSFPYIRLTEYFSTSGAYDTRSFIQVNTSGVTLAPGEFVQGAELGLYFTDSNYFGGTAGRPEYIDLWSTADKFVPGAANFTTYDGSNAWTDGSQAGIDGYARTGPAGRKLGTLWAIGNAPAGTPSNEINDNVQEYKLFKGDELDAYLTAQILAGEDAYLALSNSNDSGFGVRFVASSDVSWGGFLDNRPYLTINTAVPEPATGLVLLGLGATALSARRRCRDAGM